MEISLLILPVLGGYFFLRATWITSYETKKLSRTATYFLSASIGAIFFAIAWFATDLFTTPLNLKRLVVVAGLSFVGPMPVALLLNLAFDKHSFLANIAWRNGRLIESVLLQSMGTSRLVEVRTRDDRWYVGFPTSVHLGDDYDVGLLPVLVGHFSSNKRKKYITRTFFSNYRESDQDEVHSRETARSFQVFLPRQELVSARLFQFNDHAYFVAID